MRVIYMTVMCDKYPIYLYADFETLSQKITEHGLTDCFNYFCAYYRFGEIVEFAF